MVLRASKHATVASTFHMHGVRVAGGVALPTALCRRHADWVACVYAPQRRAERSTDTAGSSSCKISRDGAVCLDNAQHGAKVDLGGCDRITKNQFATALVYKCHFALAVWPCETKEFLRGNLEGGVKQNAAEEVKNGLKNALRMV